MADAHPGLMTIFGEALERADPADRAAYLDHACGADVALRKRVEALLAAHGGVGRFPEPANPSEPAMPAQPGETHTHTGRALETASLAPDGAATGAFASDDPDRTGPHVPVPDRRHDRPAGGDRIGTVIAGRYTLVEVVGEGGMGSVYLAIQSEPVKRHVALKLIKSGMDSKAVLARFDAERQALALMDHPNIARIYDGGITPSGQPFFVMELVKGVPLTEYCDAHRLTVDARLQLFVAVCQAVQHAHQKGIIHRDLKPGNVLVTEVDGRPTPKVIDFGVAKATEQKLTDQSFADTGAIVGTPAYMSPEQADPSSMDVDTRADVYALGVMLYELLAGSPPIDSKQFKRGAILEMLRMVREVEPQRPSTKLSTADALPNIAANRNIEPTKLANLLRGELDWVVMKALEKDRTRRYDTANGLARDIQRYLADEVVEARPPSSGYRLRKFVKRNKGQVIAAALILMALIGGIGGTTYGMIRAEEARKYAESKELAAREAEQAERLANQKAQSRLVQIENGSEILGAIFTDLDLRRIESEGKTLEEVLGGRLKAAAAKLTDDSVGDAMVMAKLDSMLGKSLYSLGHFEESIDLFKKATAIRLKALGPDDRETLATQHNLAEGYVLAGKYDEAIRIHRQTLERTQAILGPTHVDTLASMKDLGNVHVAKGEIDTGVPLIAESLRLSRLTLEPESELILTGTNSLAVAYQYQREYAKALPLFEETLRLRRKLHGADHYDTLTGINNLASCYYALNQLDKARPLMQEAYDLRRERLGPDHPHTIISTTNLAVVIEKAGDGKAALPLFEAALAASEKKNGKHHPDTVVRVRNLANCVRDLGDTDRAMILYRDYADRQGTAEGKDSLAYADALIYFGFNQLELKRWAEAEPVLRTCLEIREKKQPDAWGTFNTMSLLGGSLLGQKKYAEAEPLLRKGYEGLMQRVKLLPSPNAFYFVPALDRLIALHTALNKPDEVKRWKAERAKYPTPKEVAPSPREKK